MGMEMEIMGRGGDGDSIWGWGGVGNEIVRSSLLQ